MSYTNQRIQRVKPSETLAVKAKAAELKAQGRSIVDLSAGEPDIDTPEHIKEGARKALADGKTKYTAVNGIIELRTAIAEKLVRGNGIQATPESVIVTNGGKQAIYAFFDVTLDSGDEVVIPAPYWVSYPPIVEMCGGKAVTIATTPQSGYKITPDQLKQAITSKTKVVVLNSPSNPTGMGYSKEELIALGEVIAPSKALILSDEVYEKLVYAPFEFCSFAKARPDLAPRTVTINCFSKTYSMTGWRVGYAHGPSEVISAMGRHQSQTTSNVCSIAQYGAVAALNGSHDFIKVMQENFRRRFEIAQSFLRTVPTLELGNEPHGAFYLFPRATAFMQQSDTIRGSADLANFLLEEVGVAVVPGEAFGDDSAFRLSVASTDENVREGMKRVAEALGATPVARRANGS